MWSVVGLMLADQFFCFGVVVWIVKVQTVNKATQRTHVAHHGPVILGVLGFLEHPCDEPRRIVENIENVGVFTLELSAFVDSIRNGTTPPVDGYRGLDVVATLTAAEESLLNGGEWVKVAAPSELLEGVS